MLLELPVLLCLLGTFVYYLFYARPSSAAAASALALDPAYTGPLDAAGAPLKGAKEYHAWLSQHGGSPMKPRAPHLA